MVVNLLTKIYHSNLIKRVVTSILENTIKEAINKVSLFVLIVSRVLRMIDGVTVDCS